MTAVPRQNDIARNIGVLSRELDGYIAALEAAERDAAVLRAEADLAESRAFLNAEGPMEIRKHTARIAAHNVEAEASVAEALVRVLRQKIAAVKVRIEVGRTMSADARAELLTLGLDGAT